MTTQNKTLFLSYNPLTNYYESYITTQFLNFFQKTETHIDLFYLNYFDIFFSKHPFLDSNINIIDDEIYINNDIKQKIKNVKSNFINYINNLRNVLGDINNNIYNKIIIFGSLSEYNILLSLCNTNKINLYNKNIISFINFQFKNENINLIKSINEISSHIIVSNEYFAQDYKKIITKPISIYYGFIPNILNTQFKNVIKKENDIFNNFLNKDDILIANLYLPNKYSNTDVLIASFQKLLFTLYTNKKFDLLVKTKLILVNSNNIFDIQQIINNNINEFKYNEKIDEKYLLYFTNNIKIIQVFHSIEYDKLLQLYNSIHIHINVNSYSNHNEIELYMELLDKYYIYPNISSSKNFKYLNSPYKINDYVDIYNTYDKTNQQGGLSYVYNIDNIYDILHNVYNSYLNNNIPQYNVINKNNFKQFISKYNNDYELQFLCDECNIDICNKIDLKNAIKIKNLYIEKQDNNNLENTIINDNLDSTNICTSHMHITHCSTLNNDNEKMIDVSQINDESVEKNKELLNKILEYEEMINKLKSQIQL